jgi:hypothetical protein
MSFYDFHALQVKRPSTKIRLGLAIIGNFLQPNAGQNVDNTQASF